MKGKNLLKGTLVTAVAATTAFALLPKLQVKAVDGIDPSCLTYSAHVQNIGWMSAVNNGATAGTTGRALRVEALKINLEKAEDLGFNYDVHVQNVGWINGVGNGEIAGTEGRSLRVEALRININKEKLAEQGYELKYRAHVENIGWQDWVNAGEIAGTEGRSLRVEGLEIKLVKTAAKIAEEAALEEAKNTSKDNLDKFEDALVKLVEDGNLQEEEYEEIYNEIEELKNEIDEATKQDDIDKKMNKMIRDLNDVVTDKTQGEKDIEKLAKETEKEVEEASENANKLIDLYQSVLNEMVASGEITPTTAKSIQSVINKAKEEVSDAVTAKQIDDAKEKMKDILSNYKKYDLNIAKKEAINELNETYADVNEGITDYIADRIQEIKDAENKGKIEEVFTKIDNDNIDNVIDAQKAALSKLDTYLDVLEDTDTLSDARKELVRNAINKSKTDVKKASEEGKIADAMNTFHEKIANNSYDNFKNEVSDEVDLRKALKDAEDALKDYSDSEYMNVKKLAKEIMDYCKLCNTPDQINDIITIVTSTDEDKFEGYTGKINDEGKEVTIKNIYKEKADAETEENTAKAKKQAYNALYKEVNEDINDMEEVLLGSAKLTEKERAEIIELIANTRASVEETSKTLDFDGLCDVKDAFDSFISNNYEDEVDEARDIIFEKTKNNAIDELNNYKDSEITVDQEKVSDIAKEALNTINAIEVDDVDAIATIKTTLKDSLEEIELLATKCNALAKISELETLEGYSDNTLFTVTEAKNQDPKVTKTIANVKATIKGANIVKPTQQNPVGVSLNEAKATIAQALTDKMITTIRDLLTSRVNALNSIENYNTTIFEGTQNEITVDQIRTNINQATDKKEVDAALTDDMLAAIKDKEDLPMAKQNAIEELEEYAEDVDVSTIAYDYMLEVEKATTTSEVNELLKQAKAAFAQAGVDKEAKKAEELRKAKADAIAYIDEITELAQKLEINDLIDFISDYKPLVNSATKKSEVDDYKQEINSYITNKYLDLKGRATVIANINEKQSADSERKVEKTINNVKVVDNKFLANHDKYIELLNEAKKDIKDKEKIPANVEETFNTGVENLENDIKEYLTARNTNIGEVKALNQNNKATALVTSYINKIEAITYEQYKAYEGEQNTTVFTAIVEEATARINDYIKYQSYLEDMNTAKLAVEGYRADNIEAANEDKKTAAQAVIREKVGLIEAVTYKQYKEYEGEQNTTVFTGLVKDAKTAIDEALDQQ